MAVDAQTCSLLSSHGARRGKRVWVLLGSIFLGSSLPSAGARPPHLSLSLSLPLEPVSPVRVFSVVVHECSCVPPVSLFVEAGPTLRNLNAL